jgi:hypothetical protein
MSKKWLETEVIRTLNSVRFTRAYKREMRQKLLKEMDEKTAIFALKELRAAINNIVAATTVISSYCRKYGVKK